MEQISDNKRKSIAISVIALMCGVLGYYVVWPAVVSSFLAIPRLPSYAHELLFHLEFGLQTRTILRGVGGLLALSGVTLGIIGIVHSVRCPRRVAGIITGSVGIYYACFTLYEIVMSIILFERMASM